FPPLSLKISLLQFSLVGVLILRLFLDLFGAVPPRQGFFFFEDIGFKYGLNVDPSKLQILPDSADLPMVGKPLYGLVSDYSTFVTSIRFPTQPFE
ncbi:hypothetical protein S83_051245, partial [Arachis hypogaea]